MKPEICKKSCCWSPFEVCARQNRCSCHTNVNHARDLIRAQKYQFQKLQQEPRSSK